jgi:hypothetical protein
MASKKCTPSLPASSRMQMPSGNGGSVVRQKGSMSAGSGTSSKSLKSASGGGLKSKNPY